MDVTDQVATVTDDNDTQVLDIEMSNPARPSTANTLAHALNRKLSGNWNHSKLAGTSTMADSTGRNSAETVQDSTNPSKVAKFFKSVKNRMKSKASSAEISTEPEANPETAKDSVWKRWTLPFRQAESSSNATAKAQQDSDNDTKSVKNRMKSRASAEISTVPEAAKDSVWKRWKLPLRQAESSSNATATAQEDSDSDTKNVKNHMKSKASAEISTVPEANPEAAKDSVWKRWTLPLRQAESSSNATATAQQDSDSDTVKSWWKRVWSSK